MEFKQKRAMTEADSELFQDEASRHVSNCGTSNVILIALYTIIQKGDFTVNLSDVMKTCQIIHVLLHRYEKEAHRIKAYWSGQDTSVTVRNNVLSFLTQLNPLCTRVHSNASVRSRNRVVPDSNTQNTKQSWRLARQCQWSNVTYKLQRVVLMQYVQFQIFTIKFPATGLATQTRGLKPVTLSLNAMSGKMLPRKSRRLGLILVHLHIYVPQAQKNDSEELAKLMEKNQLLLLFEWTREMRWYCSKIMQRSAAC